MESSTCRFQNLYAAPLVASFVLGGVLLFFWILCKEFATSHKRKRCHLPPLPEVPGWPVIGNLLQLTEKKPHKTFTKWAGTYGPVYSIRLGSSTVVVLNSNDVAREAMVTRYSSISSRKLSSALQVLTSNKCMVAMSDYNEFHKMVKRCILTNLLGANAQKRRHHHRDTLIHNVTEKLRADMKSSPAEAIKFRKTFESELFGLALKQALGRDVNSVYVEELETTLSRDEIFKVLVSDMMAGAIEVDWRDFFPYLKWIPNRSFETKIQQLSFRRTAVTKALIRDQKQLTASGEEENCYLNVLMSGASLSEDQVANLLWETIIETADTTLVTTEWALYELSKDLQKQDRLYRDIEKACGSERITEDHLSQVPYLSAVFHETLRKHSPVPVVPLRYAHEDTELGGYFIHRGSEIAINIYGCNMDKKQWENPEQWFPERFMDEKYDPADLYKTMAFGGGKRVCAGSLQAMLVSCAAIGRLVQEFEWRLKDSEEENVDTVCLTTRKLHPIQTILKPRKQ